jgi:hypothetical protein
MDNNTMLRNRICNVVAVICIANWFAWALISFSVGGTAFNGKLEGGQYFFLNHSRYVPVSSTVFEYSRIHGYAAFTGLGVGAWAAITKTLANRKKDETRV